MKINTNLAHIETNIDSPVHNFSIALTAHAFKTLSDGIYRDKHKAVVRELLCNHRDAQIEAGVTEPLQVHLPTPLVSEFWTQDQGTGMSHRKVTRLYTTMFASTRQASDVFTGGFGVGSKAPLALVDQFTVTSIYRGKRKNRKHGVKSVYLVFKNERGCPSIVRVSREITEEPSGVRVFLPIEDYSSDSIKLKSALEAFLLTFDCAVLVNGEIPALGRTGVFYAELSNGWRCEYEPFAPYYYRSVRIVMSGVAYPATIKYNHPFSYSAPVTFYVPDGTYLPTLSRESLEEFSKEQQDEFDAALKEAAEEAVTQRTKDEIEKLSSFIDAVALADKANDAINSSYPFVWGESLNLTSTILTSIPPHSLEGVTFYHLERSHVSKITPVTHDQLYRLLPSATLYTHTGKPGRNILTLVDNRKEEGALFIVGPDEAVARAVAFLGIKGLVTPAASLLPPKVKIKRVYGPRKPADRRPTLTLLNAAGCEQTVRLDDTVNVSCLVLSPLHADLTRMLEPVIRLINKPLPKYVLTYTQPAKVEKILAERGAHQTHRAYVNSVLTKEMKTRLLDMYWAPTLACPGAAYADSFRNLLNYKEKNQHSTVIKTCEKIVCLADTYNELRSSYQSAVSPILSFTSAAEQEASRLRVAYMVDRLNTALAWFKNKHPEVASALLQGNLSMRYADNPVTQMALKLLKLKTGEKE